VSFHRSRQNVDLYPTFVQLAGAEPTDRSKDTGLVPLLHPSKTVPTWLSVALSRSAEATTPRTPHFEGGGSNPTTYEAIRVSAKHLAGFKGAVDAVYVEYENPQHETEFYDIKKDPYEQRNIAPQLTGAQRSELHRVLAGLESCHTASACWSARHRSEPRHTIDSRLARGRTSR